MRRALELAAHGRGLVSPNPLVGAVVLRDGVLMGEGFHAGPGESHAEVLALREAGEAARGGTLYVSLEPCRHHGRTPPCTDAIIAAGVARVVFAARDPHPEAGGGAGTLEAAGVTVERGLLRDEAVELNAPFLWRVATGRPLVILKFAQSLDGRIAARRGRRTPLTGEASLADVHGLRAGVDAVLVGRNTVATDDPLLTSRGGPPAVRVVLDSEASLARTSRLAATVGDAPVLVVTAPEAPAKRTEGLRALGIEVEAVPRAPNGGLDPAAVLGLLGARGMNSVLVEGGAEVAHSFLAAGLVERFVQYVAPVWLGEAGVPMFGPVEATGTGGGDSLWRLAGVARVGADARLTWERRAAFDALREAA
jgi:diaminohydroxyphosphoribosylaminopyrimidine deaminase/5-amino-6-(5-phosphoribosylamino)uracil reductase